MMYPPNCVKLFRPFWMVNPMLSDLLIFLFRKEVKTMAVIYATLIVKGKKTFAQVPARIQDQVKEILTDLDCPELAQ
jgi:hypothetical protein